MENVSKFYSRFGGTCFFIHRDDKGTTFVVKDVDRFAAEAIPEYFKHKNFQSFVRQLNIYGFRKIKNENLRIEDKPEAKFWKFGHEHFQQGRFELLARMGKNANADGGVSSSSSIIPESSKIHTSDICSSSSSIVVEKRSDKQTIELLHGEIKDLKESLSKVTIEVAELKTLVNSLIIGQDRQDNAMELNRLFPVEKKRKEMEYPVPLPVLSAPELPPVKTAMDIIPIPVVSAYSPANKDESYMDVLDDICNDKDDTVSLPPLPSRPSLFCSHASRSLSPGSYPFDFALDEDPFKELFEFDIDLGGNIGSVANNAVEVAS